MKTSQHLVVSRLQSGDEWRAEGFVFPKTTSRSHFYQVLSSSRMEACTHRRAATADRANEAVGLLAANWAVSAKTGVRHLFVTEEHLVASRPSAGPFLSVWCDINSSSSKTEKKKLWKTRNDKQTEDWEEGVGGDTKRPAEEDSARSS